MDTLQALKDYGWLGVLFLFFAPRAWDWLTKTFFPARMRAQQEAEKALRQHQERADERASEALQAEREARTTLLKAQIDREKRESEHRIDIDKRVAAAIENTATVIQQMGLAITVNNERLTQLISAHSRHDNFVIDSHEDIKQKLLQIEDAFETKRKVEELRAMVMDTQEKIKPVIGKATGE